jgi:hypothetical protein
MTYLFKYDGTNPPTWEKSFESSGGEVFSVSLVFENEDDRMQLTAEQAYQHMENMLQYVKDRTREASLIKLEDPAPTSYWPFNTEYDRVDATLREIQKWWEWAYYSEKFESTDSSEDTPPEEPA